jgi:nitronate monooxygenase
MGISSHSSRLPSSLTSRLRIPVIAAPMLHISGVDLVIAACRGGVIGSFPTANAQSVEELDDWLTRIEQALGSAQHPVAPLCPNLIMRRPRFQDDLDCLIRHKVEMVITSVGSPAAAVKPLHDIGALVFADVASLRHAEKALEAGADGLILLSAGAGGQTGWANPFAFVRAVRGIFDGPIVLAGGISDGEALAAARILGCDLTYMGTRFIAVRESMASEAYRQMLVDSTLDDVMLTKAITGLDTSVLRPSVTAAGIDLSELSEPSSIGAARQKYGSQKAQEGKRRWIDIWSAGHSVSGVDAIKAAAELIEEIAREYEAARAGATQLRRSESHFNV